MPKTETKIKPCPFCGSTKPSVSNEYDVFDRWRVICRCGAEGPTEAVDHGHESSVEGAVELWNKRPT